MTNRLGFIFFFCALAAVARAGSVVTRDGATLSGDVKLANDRVTLTPKTGPRREFGLTDLATVTFAQPTSAADPAYPKSRREPQTIALGGPVFVEYFGDTEFKERRLARYEPTVNAAWDRKSLPDPAVPERCSVRYTAQLVAPTSDRYTITGEGHGPWRLWINDKLTIDQSKAKGPTRIPANVNLQANTPVAVRMEVAVANSGFHARLDWSAKNKPTGTITTECYERAAGAPAPPEISITSPKDESAFRNPDAIGVDVAVHPVEGRNVARVELVAGGEVLGAVEGTPNHIDWRNPPAGLYHLRVRATDEQGVSGYSDSIDVTVADAGKDHSLPAPWGQQTLGKKETRVPGTAAFDNGTFTITKAGGQITEDDDSPQFVYQPVEGDFQIVAHLASLTPRGNTVGPLAGLLVRENMTGRDRFIAAVVGPQSTMLARRPDYWGRTLSADRNDPGAADWLRIVRHANRLRTYTSADGGKTWSLLGAERIDFPRRVFVGLCAMARNRDVPAVATFDHVSVTPGPPAFANAVPGILFRSGTFLAADVAGMKENTLTYTRGGKRTTIPSADVARLVYKPLPSELAEQIPPDRTGVALASGDFIEGDLKEISYRVTISNLVFGPRTFNIKGNDVLAVYVKPADAPSAKYVITTTDGCIYQSATLKTSADIITLQDPTLGPVTVALKDVAGIKVN